MCYLPPEVGIPVSKAAISSKVKAHMTRHKLDDLLLSVHVLTRDGCWSFQRGLAARLVRIAFRNNDTEMTYEV